MVFLPKTVFCLGNSCPLENQFFLGKLGISLQDQVFRSKECVFHLLFVRVANKCCQYGSSVNTIAIRSRLALALYNRLGNSQDIIRISVGVNR